MTRCSKEKGGAARALACLAFAALGVIGCFTNPINRAPVVTELDYDSIPMREDPVTFTAHGYDPDQDQFTWSWATRPPKVTVASPTTYTCPDASNDLDADWQTAFQSAVSSTADSPASYVVTVASTPLCVWAFATDRYGAVGADVKTLVPSNNPPQAKLRLVTPAPNATYPAYTIFEVSADPSFDPDGDLLTPSWVLQVPPGSAAPVQACANDPTNDLKRCFQADAPGQYTYTVTVSDGMASSTATLALQVLDDQPPCIAVTMPDFQNTSLKDNPTAPKPIMVTSVTDDGDPYLPNLPSPLIPPDPNIALKTVSYTWFKGKNDTGVLEYVDNSNFPVLNLLPTDYQPGDVANIRLEVHDRKPTNVDAILLNCGNAPFCPTALGSKCFVRVSWRITMSL